MKVRTRSARPRRAPSRCFNDALLERHGAVGFAKLLGDAARQAVARSRA